MANQLSIALKNVRFRAFHGLYPEERQKGNDFVVNMTAQYAAPEQTVVAIGDTVDYSSLFNIINHIMQEPVDLLETLVQSIALEAHRQFPALNEITVSVEKLNPPIDKFEGSAAVTFRATY
ncbi:MAG: dihydroneopterin aldolase [Chitinophagaceae bacterium]|nr:MAG: dihydroneopterin aldolase [Chitinophagaceae bacterium]